MSTKRWSSRLLSGFLSFVLFFSAAAASLLGPVSQATAATGSKAGSFKASAVGGVIEGKVLGEDGQPLPFGTAVSITAISTSDDEWAAPSTTQAGLDGSYRLTVAPGEYAIGFEADGNYVREFYDNARTWDAATKITVASGETKSGINAKLEKGGCITGKVTNNEGEPLEGIEVNVSDAEGSYYDYAETDSKGNYTFDALPTGQYAVSFNPAQFNESEDTDYIAEWYDGKSDSPIPVSVTQGQDTPNISASLSVGGRITGKVTDENGKGFFDAWVYAYDASQSNPDESLASAYTEKDGSYTMRGLPVNTAFKVEFEPYDSIHVAKWYDNSTTYAGAKALKVAVGETKNGINAKLDKGGRILGKVVNAKGEPVVGVQVAALSEKDDFWGAEGETDEKGAFVIEGLSTAKYRLDFETQMSNDDNDTDYLSEWYNDKHSFDEATPISVTQGKDTSGIATTLATGGRITGKVTNETGKAVALAAIYAYDAAAAEPVEGRAFAETGRDGSYVMRGLPANVKYKVQFCGQPEYYGYGQKTDLVSEWYDNSPNYSNSVPVSVIPGKATTGISAQLAKGSGGISGKVTNDIGEGASDAMLVLYDSQNRPVSSTYAFYDGSYQLNGLAPGMYKLRIDASLYNEENDRLQCSEWYHDAAMPSAATTIEVKADTVTSGINEQLSNAADETVPPTVPTNLKVARTGNALKLNWTASTDNVLVSKYKIERTTNPADTNWPVIATPSTNFFTDKTASPNVRYYYRVLAVDAEENVSNPSNVANGIVDTIKPSAPAGLKVTLAGGSFSLSWKKSNDNVGVSSYMIERSTKDQSNWKPIMAASDTTKTDGGLASETVYYYRVRAYDAAGNASDCSNVVSAKSVKQSSISKEETAPYLTWKGTWSSVKNSSYSGGAAKRSNEGNASFEIPFRGTSISWIGSKANNLGIARLYIDGKAVKEVDQYAATPSYQQTLFSKAGLADTAHTLKIEVTGRNRAGSKGTFIDVDAVKVGGYCPGINFEESAATKTGTWSTSSDPLYSGTSAFTSTTANSAVEFAFTGTSITWIGELAANRGIAKVYIDDIPPVTVDQYSAGSAFQQAIYSKVGLANGKHKIKIVATGTKREAATDKIVDVDSFVVR